MDHITHYNTAAREFLADCRTQNKSAQTIQAYNMALHLFGEFLRTTPEFSAAGPTYEAVRAWRDHLAVGHCANTVRQYLRVLRIFFTWASDISHGASRFYAENPVSRTLTPKVPERPYEIILTDAQAAKLFVNERPAGSPCRAGTWARNYALVVLALTTELRNAEILALTPEDIDFAHGEITVESGKGCKFRVVDMPPIAATALQLYLQDQESKRPRPTAKSTLFGTFGDPRRGETEWRPGSRQWLSKLIEAHVKNVTGVPGVTSHDLRHVGARIDLNAGMRMEELQAKLGHSNLSTTQIYCGRLMARRGRVEAEKAMESARLNTMKNMEKLHTAV